ncbi:AI-2E family transporter [Candidatus Woesearchaeota archaeon]|nr:AI-2E family transporter [Candidatus Woesearchaeota archaeon]
MEVFKYSKIFFITIVIILALLSFALIRPLISAILLAIIFAYVFYPVHRWIAEKSGRETLSALVTTLLILLVIAVPIGLLVNAVSREAVDLYTQTKDKLDSENPNNKKCELNDLLCRGFAYFSAYMAKPEAQTHLDAAINKFTGRIVQLSSEFLLAVPKRILEIFVMFFIIFYLLRDGKQFVLEVEKYLPVHKRHHKQIFNQFNDVTYAVIFGNFIVALVQGALATLAFVVLGVSSPFVWGVIMTFFAFIPYVGPAVIWFPAAIILMLDGYAQDSNLIVFKGIILLLWGIFVVSLIDNVLKPKIIGDRARIHPIAVLLGVIGGLQLFGFVGIIAGPLIIAMLITFVKIYRMEEVEAQRD